jgi:hypothetical protein
MLQLNKISRLFKILKAAYNYYFNKNYINEIKEAVDKYFENSNEITNNEKIGTINIKRYKKYDLYNFESIELNKNILFKEYIEILDILELFDIII